MYQNITIAQSMATVCFIAELEKYFIQVSPVKDHSQPTQRANWFIQSECDTSGAADSSELKSRRLDGMCGLPISNGRC
jgi:hypothetical protein